MSALYRKYRPLNFFQVIGQEPIVRSLVNSLIHDRISHAYLFAGPKGTGKTTVARILARALNCQNLKDKSEPCNKCSSCQEIINGASLDIIELDGASNRGIEEIRELREGIKFSPSGLKYKVFIIDEVHMLTTPAFNALLKTLEEPPAHAIFILATTEAHKVLPTIISRCQRYDFRKLTLKEQIEQLRNIAEKEGVSAEEDALRLIGVVSSGDLRDAISILDQVISGKNKVILSEVQKIIGASDIRPIIKLIDYLAKREAKSALGLINKLNNQGLDLFQYLRLVINFLRNLLILKTDSKLRELATPELTDSEFETIMRLSKKFTEKEIIKIISIFLEAQNQIQKVHLTQLPLEMAVVEICLRGQET